MDSPLQASMTFNSTWYSESYVHMLKNLALQKEPMALEDSPAHWVTGVGQMTFVLQHWSQQQCQKDVHSVFSGPQMMSPANIGIP